eukprot:TRINITY_DN12714_c0_g1_i3.p1 TRINITY_DN12714_c0_g1~~TRINITY_DN12714_c0_g1_i3.p1  ORF type:complete len:346 (+),score=63.36 TRINITY_DN12714_c0_g1_i3:55-1092(+)
MMKLRYYLRAPEINVCQMLLSGNIKFGRQQCYEIQSYQQLRNVKIKKRVGRKGGAALKTLNSWQEVGGVVVFSAIPFAIVQGLADSPYGKQLAEDLQKKIPELRRQSEKEEQKRMQARQQSKWYGSKRPKWLGPLPYQYPEYLQGDYPGDYGFDVLGLGKEPEKLEKMFEFELLHARWAMLGALGAILPEILQYSGVTKFLEPVWWNVGYAKLSTGEDLDYLGLTGFRIAGSQGIAIIAFCQVILMYGPEYARYCGINALEPVAVYLPGDKNYPGGFLFDPLGLSKNPAQFENLRIKEIKNGRLAMLAWLGFAFQAFVTQKGPVANALDFWSDPVQNNVFHFLSK